MKNISSQKVWGGGWGGAGAPTALKSENKRKERREVN